MILSIDLEVIQFYLLYSVYAFLSIGLIFFVVNGIVRDHANYVFRAFINLIVGGTMTLGFAICWIVDAVTNHQSIGHFPYIVFLCISLLLTVIISLSYFSRGRRTYQRLTFKKVQPSVNRDINQYVYVVYKCNKQIILRKEKGNYQGFIFEMNKKQLFKDEIISNFNSEFAVEPSDDNIHEYGLCAVNGKKPSIYYCYLIEIDNISDQLSGFEIVDAYDVVTLNMEDVDKQIILRTLTRQEFKIYL